MVTVCAWCRKYMGSKEPLDDPEVSHGICSACVERQMRDSAPIVVVSPGRVGTIPLLRSLLLGAPDIAIVVDRRSKERRNGHGSGPSLPADRRLFDRRRSPALYLV